MTVFETDFTSGQVIRAAGITNAALQTWVRRKLIVGGKKPVGVDMPGRAGVRRTFSFFNVVEIAMAAALIETGAPPVQAFRAGAHFAHFGDRERLPSIPFEDGRTYLFMAGDRSIEATTSYKTDPLAFARHYLGNPRSFNVVDASAVFDGAMAALGYHPQQIKDEAYGGGK